VEKQLRFYFISNVRNEKLERYDYIKYMSEGVRVRVSESESE
jgi:hypothetical protein